jgi:hypothetical protein
MKKSGGKKGARSNRNPSKHRGIMGNGKHQKGGGGTGKTSGKTSY